MAFEFAMRSWAVSLNYCLLYSHYYACAYVARAMTYVHLDHKIPEVLVLQDSPARK